MVASPADYKHNPLSVLHDKKLGRFAKVANARGGFAYNSVRANFHIGDPMKKSGLLVAPSTRLRQI